MDELRELQEIARRFIREFEEEQRQAEQTAYDDYELIRA